jgi:VWFA-related protein
MKNSLTLRGISLAASIVAVVAPSIAFPPRQQTVRVESAFVQIDATVTDKAGNRIHGLKAENFQIFEDRTAQKITAVDFCQIQPSGLDVDANPVSIDLDNPTDPDSLRAIGASHRLIVLFFDRTTMEPEDTIRSVESARAFVKDQMTPADLVTVATYGTQLVVNSNFTNDRAALDQTLGNMISGKESRTGKGKATLDDSVSHRSGIATVDRSLSAAEALVQLLAQIPGRKSVIYFSNGLQQRGMDHTDSLGAVDAVTGAANRNNVSIYAVDARALLTIVPPGGSARALMAEIERIAAERNTLFNLAKDTNGEVFLDQNDFAPMFKFVQDESTNYYLLTFDPSNKKKDGSYRQMEIKLVNVPGGRIVFRHGYYAPSK